MADSVVLFRVMLIVAGVTLVYPWHPRWSASGWLVHLPLLLLPLWARYEATIPSGMNIRVDLLVIVPGLLLCLVLYALRLIFFARLRNQRVG